MPEQEIKAIETVYDGYRFRSRLEARWAVFFDTIGLEFQYEPEGFIGVFDTPYLPDFYFPGYDIYAEVKGSDERLKIDLKKIICAMDYKATPISRLIILGDIPNPEYITEYRFPYFSALEYDRGVRGTTAMFFPHMHGDPGLRFGYDQMHFKDHRISWWDALSSDLSDIQEITTQTSWMQFNIEDSDTCGWLSATSDELFNASLTARQARFEHGEKPRKD